MQPDSSTQLEETAPRTHTQPGSREPHLEEAGLHPDREPQQVVASVHGWTDDHLRGAGMWREGSCDGL